MDIIVVSTTIFKHEDANDNQWLKSQSESQSILWKGVSCGKMQQAVSFCIKDWNLFDAASIANLSARLQVSKDKTANI